MPKLVAIACFTAMPLAAQDAVIKGRVTAVTGDPLGGANVVVANTNTGAVTAANGAYTLTVGASAVRGQQVILTARYIGHKPVTRTITLSAGEQQQDFSLESDPLRLEEVVVTGVAEATDRRKLGFTVGSISNEQMKAVPATNPIEGMQGRIAGVRLAPQSAQPGSEPAVRLRGATSISGRQDPLYIVDGVISRYGLADIAAQDVERIEVVKGAAASSLYGSNGANGVVQIFTKRGNSVPEGSMQVTVRTEAGVNTMPRRMQFSKSHFWEIEQTPGYCAATGLAQDDPSTPEDESQIWTPDANDYYCLKDGTGRIARTDQVSATPFPVYHDHWGAMVNAGPFATQYISIGQRRGTTNFNASFENTRNKGVIFGLAGYTRRNTRLNLDYQMRPNLDVSFSTFYGTSTNGRAAEGTGSPFFQLMFVQPDVDITACCNPDSSPYVAKVPLSGDVANDQNPMYELNTRKITRDRNRFTGAAKLRWRMQSWLSAEGSFGYDQEGDFYKDLFPKPYYDPSGLPDAGSLRERTLTGYQYNTGVTLTSIRRFSNVTNTIKIGTVYEHERIRGLETFAGKLRVGGVPEFGGVDVSSLAAGSADTVIKNFNYFGVTTFDIKDRYIIDALVRRDGSSLFGENNRWATYYRVSGAWRLTEDMRVPGLDEWRLRASYGTAGLRPGYDNQYEILSVTSTGFSKVILGNPNLKPARASELEIGTNFDLRGGRVSIEYTYARKDSKDQILLVDLPAVTGFADGQWQNAGGLLANTHEITLAARLINTARTGLTLNIVGDRTRQKITDWSLPERLYGFQQMPAAFFLGRNRDLGVLYGNRWVRNISELYDDPDKAAQNGVGQAWSSDSVMINEDGYVVRRSTYGTKDERAIKYVYCKRPGPAGTCLGTDNLVEIGSANPDFNLSFNLAFNHRRLAVNALLDWSYGGELYNGTRQWAFQAARDRVQDQAGKAPNDATCGVVSDPMPSCPRKADGYYGVGFYNGLESNDFFIESGSYAKLKELSLSYTLSSDQLRRIGFLRSVRELRLAFIARNLFTITKYSGLDPEVSGLNGDPFQVRMDWFQYPQFRTFTGSIELGF
ncbi:MAG TPA: SusC/RagA family TonB-linked outer membrane protein [Gemmatimonadales bacterium]|nr:SusC/RagA family TonB-linked outer membrane protein [Gemmatimonadales bacterium]